MGSHHKARRHQQAYDGKNKMTKPKFRRAVGPYPDTPPDPEGKVIHEVRIKPSWFSCLTYLLIGLVAGAAISTLLR
jgi:hypothetical protein